MIYLYLFGTCFHFIYVFMIIGNICLCEDLPLGVFFVEGVLTGLGEAFLLPECFVLSTGSLEEPVRLQRAVGGQRSKNVSG